MSWPRDPARTNAGTWILVGFLVVTAILLSWVFASACEPQSLWWWRDVFHVLDPETCR